MNLDNVTPSNAAGIRNAIDLGLKATAAYNRPDLGDRLERSLSQLEDPNVNVVVVGEFKQGKSSLINALLNTRVCPVDDDIATAVPTFIRHGDEQSAVAMLRPRDQPDAEVIRRPISFDLLPAYATEVGPAEPGMQVTGVDLTLPRRILSDGLVLIDTPGVGGLGSAHATAALGALSVANAVIFVSDASQEFTRAEIDFLSQAVELSPQVVCVMTKTDFYPAWRTVLEINQAHLEREGYSAPILPVSSVLRSEAARRKDRELNAESGFPAVVSWLSGDVVAGANGQELLRAQADVLSACDQLQSQFESELATLSDPEQAAELVSQLEGAKTRSDRLRSQAARWNVTLSDGISDLNADVDFDFKSRVRGVTTESDSAIDNSDPLETWAEFEPWLVNRVSYEVVSNYRYLIDQAQELSNEVAEHFEIEGAALSDQFDVHNPMAVLNQVSLNSNVDQEGMSTGAKGFTILRGSYTGILMFTMLGAMVGVALTPVAIGIGLLMGRKGLKDEKERQISQRRSQAKISLRRYSDEVSFQVSKDSRDTLRRVHRQLRDHYSTRAEELHRSTTESLKLANEASKVSHAERSGRIKDAEAELQRIARLRKMANEALPGSVQPAGASS